MPAEAPDASLRSITIRVVAVYGSEDLPVGVSRTFLLTDDGSRWRIEGKELSARQIRDRAGGAG